MDGGPVTRRPPLATPAQRVVVGMCSLLVLGGLCWFLTAHILLLFGVWLLGVMVATVPIHMADSGLRIEDENAELVIQPRFENKWGRWFFCFLRF